MHTKYCLYLLYLIVIELRYEIYTVGQELFKMKTSKKKMIKRAELSSFEVILAYEACKKYNSLFYSVCIILNSKFLNILSLFDY